jgi:hypothetical protein
VHTRGGADPLQLLAPRIEGRVVDEIANRSLEDSLRLVIHMDVETRRSFSRLNEHFYGRYHHTFDLLTAGARGPPPAGSRRSRHGSRASSNATGNTCA